MRIRGQTRGRPKYFQRFSNGFRRVPHIIRSSLIASADIQRSVDPWVLWISLKSLNFIFSRENIKSEYVGEKWFNCPVMEDRPEEPSLVTSEPQTNDKKVKYSMLQRLLGRSGSNYLILDSYLLFCILLIYSILPL